ncbi:MAG: DMT family transporter [Pseudomonadota bacterium]
MTTQLRMGPLEWGMLITLSLLWGGSFFFGKVAVAELPPLTLAFLRVGIAAVLLWTIVAALRRDLSPLKVIWLPLIVLGVLNNVVPFSLILWGQQEIGAGLASILNATTPVFTVIVANAFLADERLTPGKAVGIALGVLGVAVLVGLDSLSGLGGNVMAQLACLGAALSYGLAATFARRFRGIPPVLVATGQLTASSLVLLPIILMLDAPWTLGVPSVGALWSIILLGSISTGLAYILYFRIIRAAGATNGALVTLLVPVSAILLGAIVLGERLAATDFLGMALIGLGLLAIDGRPLAFVAQAFGRTRAQSSALDPRDAPRG